MAEEAGAAAGAMRAASASLARDVEDVSAGVAQNAAAAQELQASCQALADLVVPITQAAITQSRAASEVSAAVGELGLETAELAATTEVVRARATDLDGLVRIFRAARGGEPVGEHEHELRLDGEAQLALR